MKLLYKIIRILIVTVILFVAVVPAVLYVALSTTGVQRRIADRIEHELSELLDVRVTVGDMGIMPFNRVILRDVTVQGELGDTIMTVSRLGAGVSLWEMVTSGKPRIGYLQLIGMDARISRDSVGAPLNIQPIINALQPKDKNKPPTAYDVKISTVVIRSSTIRYDVNDRPRRDGFDPSHIMVTNFRGDINLPRISNGAYEARLRRLAFEEQSGLTVEQLGGEFLLTDSVMTVRNFELRMPGSELSLADISLPLDGIPSIGESLRRKPLDLEITPGCHVALEDVAPFLPMQDTGDVVLVFRQFRANGHMDDFHADLDLDLTGMGGVTLDATVRDIMTDNPEMILSELAVDGNMERIMPTLAAMGVMKGGLATRLAALGDTRLTATGAGSLHDFSLKADVATAQGALSLSGDGGYKDRNNLSGNLEFSTDGELHLSQIVPSIAPATFTGHGSASYSVAGRNRHGAASLTVDAVTIKGTTLSDIEVEGSLENDIISGIVSANDESLMADLAGSWSLDRHHPAVTLDGVVSRLRADRFGLLAKYPGAVVSGEVSVDMAGESFEHMEGYARVSDLRLKPADSEGITMKILDLTAVNLEDGTSRLQLANDWLDGYMVGSFDFRHLGESVQDVIAGVFPSLLPAHRDHQLSDDLNDFLYDFRIKETEDLAAFFKLPVSVIYPLTIRGGVDTPAGSLDLNLSAPYLRQGGKLIENTALSVSIGGESPRADLNFTTTAPTKGGPMTLGVSAGGKNDRLNTVIKWNIDRKEAYNGNVGIGAIFGRDEENRLLADVNLRESFLTFNDSTWRMPPCEIKVAGKDIDIMGLEAAHGRQYVKINGRVSPDPTALLTLDLNDFSLDYLFESLAIDAAQLGGDASGTFYASDLFSGQPRLETPGLAVKDISYNQTVLGNAVVKSYFDPETLAAMIYADILNDKRLSTVKGGIYVTRDSLDLTFVVDREPVGFLKHYMGAFASEISGYASGWARVYGNFKYIDLEGDVKADSVGIKINFTNTTYWATDSVHMRPGYIGLDGITISDRNGHTANLNGWVKHTHFKEPRFEFSITGARGLLCYDETPKENPRWYGRVYGDGGAFIKGVPGHVDIDVEMQTAPGSTFTFVLTDQIEADEYSFLTFRDKNRISGEFTDSLTLRDTSMDIVNRLRNEAARHDVESSSDYDITIQMGVTPQAEINLVMDPVGGDRIRAYGQGHIRMDYLSVNNELKMFGTYTLDRGDYNFTLQDIIIKEFVIKPGSEIAFRGDPYAAQLNIAAAYTLNANLSDLDESFLNDSELNRTNVPVNALMKVSGDIRQPEIAFDLEFPTLSSDIYRKVKSIISTDEMMNRQILYLLALNRFYTPDYMSGATRGNELVSVASSTLSSQLGNILGQISDNWNIAPALRSSRGDFSDVEVDLALSSRLLNNRLLFNGNFGYRDKSLNTNQFVGDFDLEYLLNRSGNFRLKAYNRYNDQNYYLRSALTTQGVGIVLRKDFDSLTSFLQPLFRRRKKSDVIIPLAPTSDPSLSPSIVPSLSPDSLQLSPTLLPVAPADSIR